MKRLKHDVGRYNINAKFLGPDSTLYPFKNSTFDELAAEYIPVINKLHPESKIRDLFEKGKDFNILEQGSRDRLCPSSSAPRTFSPSAVLGFASVEIENSPYIKIYFIWIQK